MRRVLFCRSICLTAEHITSHNHHLFEFEHEYTLKPQDMILLISRNASPIAQTVYKHHHFKPTNKLFHVGINIFNNSDKNNQNKKEFSPQHSSATTSHQIQSSHDSLQRYLQSRNRKYCILYIVQSVLQI